MQKRSEAVILLLITAILWSTGGFLIKLVQWHPIAIAGVRSAIAALTLILFYRRLKWHWSLSQIGGGIVYAALVLFFVTGNKLTTAANVILIQYSAPIYIAFFGNWFLGEKAGWFDWLIILVVIGGLLLFFVDELTVKGFWGNICAVMSGICLAWLFMFMRKQKDASPVESVILGNILAAFFAIPFLFRGTPDSTGWLILLIMGTLQLALPYWLFSYAIKHVTALESVLIPIIEPILNPIWVLIISGEVPGPWAITGGIIVLTAVTVRGVVINLNRNKGMK